VDMNGRTVEVREMVVVKIVRWVSGRTWSDEILGNYWGPYTPPPPPLDAIGLSQHVCGGTFLSPVCVCVCVCVSWNKI
jgi:hypothetical protein